MNQQSKSLQYFLHLSSIGRHENIPYFDEHIRLLIWILGHPVTFMQCVKCNKIVLRLSYQFELINCEERYKIQAGHAHCVKCNVK